MPFRKYQLIKYEIDPFQSLNTDGWGYTLTVLESTFWGLRKRIVEVVEYLPGHMSAEKEWGHKVGVWIKG